MTFLLSILIGIIVFIGAIYLLKNKLDLDNEVVAGLLSGYFFFTATNSIAQVVVGLITLNVVLILSGLIMALLYGFIAYYFAKIGDIF